VNGGRAFELAVRVPWADTDAAGVVWLGNFVKYVEQAEEELFRACGCPRLDLMREKILFPRTTLNCSFRSPARFDDILTIALGIDTLSERRIGYWFHITQVESRTLVVEGTYEVACVDALTFRSRDVPAHVRAAISIHVRGD
jgi:YbgC/YbaW family acyl-CoA thioester hydrolase